MSSQATSNLTFNPGHFTMPIHTPERVHTQGIRKMPIQHSHTRLKPDTLPCRFPHRNITVPPLRRTSHHNADHLTEIHARFPTCTTNAQQNLSETTLPT